MRAVTMLKWLFVMLIAGFVFAVAMAQDPAPVADPAPALAPRAELAPGPRGTADIRIVLETQRCGDRVYYVGAAGALLGVRSPDLIVKQNDVVSLTLVNGLDTVSDITIPAFGVDSGLLIDRGERATMVFQPKHIGSFQYMSSFPRMRAEGMIGRIMVEPADSFALQEETVTD